MIRRCNESMFNFFRKNRITKYTDNASEYLKQVFKPVEPSVTPKKDVVKKPHTDMSSGQNTTAVKNDIGTQQKTSSVKDSGVKFSLSRVCHDFDDSNDVQYSTRDEDESTIPFDDKYDSSKVASVMQNYSSSAIAPGLLKALDKTTNKTFVDVLVLYINQKGMRDSEVYKAAHLDRRLFSKIMSDRFYKPSKDTAVAIAIALHLSLSEANDLLSRAGYTFSHSNKKDIIIEYFFREHVYKLSDINEVLFNLGQKIIGR